MSILEYVASEGICAKPRNISIAYPIKLSECAVCKWQGKNEADVLSCFRTATSSKDQSDQR